MNTKHRPSQNEIDIVYDNVEYVIDAEKKLNKQTELIQMLFEFENPRILISLFLINTCEDGLSEIDSFEERREILEEITNCIISLEDGDKKVLEISQKILDTMLQPIPIKQNSTFLDIWGDLLEEVIELLEFSEIADNFPYCLYNYFD